MSRMGEIELTTLEPFEVDPLALAYHLLATTPWWRWLRRRRLEREIVRLSVAGLAIGVANGLASKHGPEERQ